ncbi:MAG: hypothetical protein Kow0059_13890 [Candidatus Sumerlaeia bacterium]
MSTRRVALALAAVVLGCVSWGFARDIYVDISAGSNLTGDGSAGQPFRNITFAIRYAAEPAAAGDVIHVNPGVYDVTPDASGFREIFPIELPDGVSLVGNGAMTSIFIDGSLEDRNVIEIRDSSQPIRLEGLTILGGLRNGVLIENSRNVTIENCQIMANGLNGVALVEAGFVTIANSYLRLNQNGSGLHADRASTMTIQSNQISRNAGVNGGGVYLRQCENVSIRFNTIADNTAREEDRDALGGGVCLLASTGVIEGNSISGNSASSRYQSFGGGIYCGPYRSGTPGVPDDLAQRTVTIANNTIQNNTARNGGGVAVELFNVTLSGNTISQNTALERGGGVFCLNNSPTVTLNRFEGNQAVNGGGLCAQGADPASTAFIQRNDFISNTASSTGGGATLSKNLVHLRYNQFITNSAMRGGGLYLDQNEGVAYVTGVLLFPDDDGNPANNPTVDFRGNSASQDGGAIYANRNTVEIVECLLDGNTAGGLGGALRVDRGAVRRCRFVQNIAARYAGVYSNGRVENCVFLQNTSSAGTGIVLSDFVYNNTFHRNSIQGGNGGDVEARDGDYIINNIFSETLNGVGVAETTNNVIAFVENNCFFNNARGVYLESETLFIPSVAALQIIEPKAKNNLQADPRFVNPSPLGGNLALQSTSPCIDAGRSDSSDLPEPLPAVDINNAARPGGLGWDIGAYESAAVIITAAQVYRYEFNSYEEGWRRSPPIPGFQAPDLTLQSGGLTLKARTNQLTFGFATAAAGNLTWQRGFVYRVRWRVRGAADSPDRMPAVRLRLNRLDNQINHTLGIFSVAGAHAAPDSQGTTYDVYAVPALPDGPPFGDATTAVDLVNLDPADDPLGGLTVDWVEIQRIGAAEVEGSFSPLYEAEFPGDADQWAFSGVIPPFAHLDRLEDENGLGLTAGGRFLAFGSVLSPEISAEGGRVYRLRATLGSTAARADATPGIRLRLFAGDNQMASVLSLNSALDAQAIPFAGADRTYDLYLNLPASYGAAVVRAAMDLMFFDPGDDGTAAVYVKHAAVSQAPAPLFDAW